MTQLDMMQSAVLGGRGMEVMLALRKEMVDLVGEGEVARIWFARASMSYGKGGQLVDRRE
jgi:hypothetical protein